MLSSKIMGGEPDRDMIVAFQNSYTKWSKKFRVQRIVACDTFVTKMLTKVDASKSPDTKLIVRKQGVTNVQAVALAEALSRYPIFAKIDLRDNRLTDEGSAALAQAMRIQCVILHASHMHSSEDVDGSPSNKWNRGKVVLLQKIKLDGNCVYDEKLLSNLSKQAKASHDFNLIARVRYMTYDTCESEGIATSHHSTVPLNTAIVICKKLKIKNARSFLYPPGVHETEQLISKIVTKLNLDQAIEDLAHKDTSKSHRGSINGRSHAVVKTALDSEPSPGTIAIAFAANPSLYELEKKDDGNDNENDNENDLEEEEEEEVEGKSNRKEEDSERLSSIEMKDLAHEFGSDRRDSTQSNNTKTKKRKKESTTNSNMTETNAINNHTQQQQQQHIPEGLTINTDTTNVR